MSTELLVASFTLAGAVCGALIQEFSAHLRSRRETRRLVATALADLLGVRHFLITSPLSMAKEARGLGAPAELMNAVLPVLAPALPSEEALHVRFQKAVDELGSIAPVLAFRLRTRDASVRLTTLLRQLADGASPELEQVVSRGLKDMREAIDDACLELADLHGRSTRHEVEALLSLEPSLPRSLKRRLKKLFASGASAQSAGVPSQAPPSSDKAGE